MRRTLRPKVRLFVEQRLGAGQSVKLSRAQAHYLGTVMRLAPGDAIAAFDGATGEWRCGIAEIGKRGGTIEAGERLRPLLAPPDLWLLFAPVKKARTDSIVEKATELGVARICPVATDFTDAARLRRDRLQAHAVEAAEQCEGTYVPEIAGLSSLGAVLAGWPAERRLMVCDEALAGRAGGLDAAERRGVPWAVLIGPEGGLSEAERARLAALPGAVSVSLGPRILRADTAAAAALALWQARLGDWG